MGDVEHTGKKRVEIVHDRYHTHPMPRLPTQGPDWSTIDNVLLDMDGTILDLEFDHRFWLELVPAQYAAANAMTVEAAKAHLRPKFAAREGTLDWYCLDYWARELALDLLTLKRAERGTVRWVPQAEHFLRRVRGARKRLALVTNAHPATLALKDEALDFRGHFDAIYSSHPFGTPKETSRFWDLLTEQEPFDPKRTLFVDDSLPVLRAARAHGIAWIYAVLRPDSTRPARVIDEFPSIDTLQDLPPP
jgi:putative hydrolase of the HAD superfamily